MRARIAILAAVVLLLTGTHFALGVHTHPLHTIHAIFRGLYLVPIITAAVWFGLRGSAATSLLIAAIYFIHIQISWPNQPMENVNQYVMIGVFLLVGAVSGALVEREERERRRRLESERLAQRAAIVQGFAGLCNALECRDEYTRRHSEHVAQLAVEIGRRRGLPPQRLDTLRMAALIHDIGKIGIRDDILYKPEHLTPDERARMAQHPVLAATILRPIRGTEEIADIVLAHHECPDGSGYPHGLKADQIPAEALILSVADVFSALTENRPYKPALAEGRAVSIIQSMAGAKLDKAAVQSLFEWLAEKCAAEEGARADSVTFLEAASYGDESMSGV